MLQTQLLGDPLNGFIRQWAPFGSASDQNPRIRVPSSMHPKTAGFTRESSKAGICGAFAFSARGVRRRSCTLKLSSVKLSLSFEARGRDGATKGPHIFFWPCSREAKQNSAASNITRPHGYHRLPSAWTGKHGKENRGAWSESPTGVVCLLSGEGGPNL